MSDAINYLAIGLAFLALLFSNIDPSEINNEIYIKDVKTDSLILTVPVEDDLRINAEALNIKGTSNIPDWVAFINGTEALAFDAGTMEQVYTSLQLPHTRKANTILRPHFHLTAKTNATGNASFCIEYSCSNINAQFVTTSYACGLAKYEATANKHYIVYTEAIENNLTGSAMCMLRIFRNASATIDTYTADALLLEFDVHVLNDKLGENI